MVNYLCFDTETTGLSDDAQVLTAYFIILDSDFNEIGVLDLRIRYPVYHVQLKAFQINKINLGTHDKTALDLLDARITLTNFLKKHYHNGKYIPLGHNIKFDLQQLSKNFDTCVSHYINSTFSLDTMQIAQFFKSSNLLLNTQSLSLKNLTEHYNIKPKGELHTAECDIRLTIDLFKHFQTLLIKQENTTNTNVDVSKNTNVVKDEFENVSENKNVVKDEFENVSENKNVADILLSFKKKPVRVLRKRNVVKYF